MHHDNAPAHTTILVRGFLGKNKTVIIPQPAYLPDLAPAGYLHFPKLKALVKGKFFVTIEKIKGKFETGAVSDTNNHR